MKELLSGASRLARSPASKTIAIAIVLAFAFSLCRRAINLTDEGYLLSQVVDMMEGKVLYRDMDAFVTPGIWFLLAGLFELVEPSVLSSRILAFAGLLGTYFFGYRIVAAQTTPTWGWATVGLLTVSTVWAFPAWTSTFYSPFAILFALAALDRLLTWREAGRVRDLVLCGLLLGASIATKQNYGAFATAGTLVALVAFRFEARDPVGASVRALVTQGLWLSVGAFAVLLPTIAYLAAEGALVSAFELLVLHPFDFMNRQDIPYPSLSRLWATSALVDAEVLTYAAYLRSHAPNPFFAEGDVLEVLLQGQLVERLHILLFWLPVLGAGVGAFCALRPVGERRPLDGPLFAVLAVAGFVYQGVFPRADFNHLMNVFQPTVIAAVLVVHRLSERHPRPWSGPVRSAIALGCVLLCVYTYVAGSWYVHTLRAMNTPISAARGGVLVSSIEEKMIDFNVRTIIKMTEDGDHLLTVPALAMFNFLAHRPMPGRYYNLYEHHIARDAGAGVVAAAEANEVDLVVADYNNFFSDRVGLRVYAADLANYIRTHFEHQFDVGSDRFLYLTRRPTPLEARQSRDVLDDCDFDPDGDTMSREHLLFASLYQIRDSRRPRQPVETTCRIHVPEDADLAVSIGYRRPLRATPKAALRAEIWLDDGRGESVQLLREDIPVVRQKDWKSPPSPEFRIDLARFAGRDVALTFRSTFRGRMRMNPLDLLEFGSVWQDPRIETP